MGQEPVRTQKDCVSTALPRPCDRNSRVALWNSCNRLVARPMRFRIHLRLYEELNDFLNAGRRKRRFEFEFQENAGVGEVLSSLGVPVDQVELVLVNGDSVDFSHPLKDGDFVSVYPVFESLDVKQLVRVRSEPLRRIRFLTDRGLSSLARRLQALGFDVMEADLLPCEEIVRVAESERRILLTPGPLAAEFQDMTRVFQVRSSELQDQLKEVLSRLDLLGSGECAPSIPARKTP